MRAFTSRPHRGARLSFVFLFLLTACAPFGASGAATFTLPSTTKGDVAFTPTDGAAELDPAQTEIVVRSVSPEAHLRSVTVQQQGGPPVSSPIKNGQVNIKRDFKTDARYLITAIATVRHHGSTSESTETQTSTFTTATTPRIVATNPLSIGQGQSIVLTLSPAASRVVVDGPVKGQLGPDGTTVTVVPLQYRQGQTYSFRIIAKSLRGIAGLPQAATFNTLPPATAAAYPDSGTSNLGVGIPLTVTLGSPPLDRNTLASRMSASATVNQPAPAGAGGLCAQPQYAPPAVAAGDLPVTAVWITDRRVRLVPKTADGYWPANSTIKLTAALNGLATSSGSVFEGDLTTSFSTGDKRVIDVDLSSQHLVACKNGTQANDFAISSGTASHATNVGSYYIYRRVADEEMKSPEGPFAPDFYDIKHVPWTQYFDGGEALHGAWWHNNFGHPMSHGCVNVQTPTANNGWPKAVPQAEFLWNFDNLGDPVIVRGVTPGLSAATQPSD
jgi:lipoprotein-anchoring transpeptidase ErfK/SrfK